MKNKKAYSILVAIFFLLVIITDFHYKYLLFYGVNQMKLTFIAKLIVGITLIAIMLLNTKPKREIIYLISFLGICCMISLWSLNSLGIDSSIYVMSQYFFGVVVMLFFLSDQILLNTNYLQKIVESIICINIICIILGYVFDIHVFQTYYGKRFGYSGIFKSTATASYFYMFCLGFLLVKKHKTKITYLFIVTTIVSAFLIGSKTLYAFVIFCLAIILIKKIGKRQNIIPIKAFYMFSTLLTIVICLITFIPLISLNEILRVVLEEDGIITAFFSYRDQHVMNAYANISEDYNNVNFLFGGLGYINRLTEIAIVDAFLTFGLIGTIIYVKLITINLPKITHNTTKLIMLVIAGLIFLRGNFFYYPSAMYISLAIFAITLNEINTKSKLKKA
ncbi:hypothetical protein N9H78_00775 [Winogradskyella sp.]|nr:hypothetical protein [Winogradskyella sp.]MDA8874188.1 hypothetical protein [Winogradskyella sp.]